MPKLRMTLEAEVQLVLDELWGEKLIPFALNVGNISKDVGEYTIYFHDSRIYSAGVTLSTDRPLRDVVRSSVLARVKELSGPWNWPREGLRRTNRGGWLRTFVSIIAALQALSG